jgi:hypothetical protein
MGEEEMLVNVSFGLSAPEPDAGKIPKIGSRLQVNVVPAVPLVGIKLNNELLHMSAGGILVKVGFGLTVTATVIGVPGQLLAVGVMV